MRGMAVEAHFRPATVAEWLKLLPRDRVRAVPQTVLKQIVPTIDLSAQHDPLNLPPHVQGNNTDAQPPKNRSPVLKKLRSPQVLIGTSIAIVAAIAGFGITTSLITKKTPQPQPSPQLFMPKPSHEASGEVRPINITPSPSVQDSKTPKETSAPVSTSKSRRRRRRVSSEDSPTSNVTQESPQPYSGESQRRKRDVETPTPSSSSTASTRSLTEKLRAIRDSRSVSPSPSSANKSPSVVVPVTSSSANKSPSVVVPVTSSGESKQLNPPGVVVPTQEIERQNSSADSQPHREHKEQVKVEDDNN